MPQIYTLRSRILLTVIVASCGGGSSGHSAAFLVTPDAAGDGLTDSKGSHYSGCQDFCISRISAQIDTDLGAENDFISCSTHVFEGANATPMETVTCVTTIALSTPGTGSSGGCTGLALP